jgi:aconitate hydratase
MALNTLRFLKDKTHSYYSLPALEELKLGAISRLPVSIRIMLESLLRNCDGKRVKEEDVLRLAKWNPKNDAKGEVPFVVSRVLLQDFTGVPLIVDLAAMRDAMAAQGLDPASIEPEVSVDLVVDHSVQVDRSGTKEAFLFNLKLEFERNQERYSFLKWGEGAYETFKVVPPGIGICHQVNLEHLASLILEKENVLYFDTLVGTDSHTTMINGLGIVGWGVGGIEAQAAMLGQPVFLESPDVIGVHMSGRLQEGVTATDLALLVTEMLRKENVVNKFVEFFGEGAASLTVADRATIGNMSPEYGATMGFFPADEKTLEYLRMTGRDEKHIALIKEYLMAQKLFGIPKKGEVSYTKELELDLSKLTPSVAGPKRPQDRIALSELKSKFQEILKAPSGYGKTDEIKIQVNAKGNFGQDSGGIENATGSAPLDEAEMVMNRPFTTSHSDPRYAKALPSHGILEHGSVVIAAITSCTNTSNPSVMLGAGLLAKKALEKGLRISPLVKTSLAPGSRVVTEYLLNAGLQKYLDELGFQVIAYGCTTCIGNSGPLDETIEEAIKKNDIIAASVLSGNRNFEARIHSSVKANFLMSPPLVIAFAIVGTVCIDFSRDPLGTDKSGKPVYLKDIWPSSQEIEEAIASSIRPSMFKERYANIMTDNPIWAKVEVKKSAQYHWDPKSTYIQKPPYFDGFSRSLPERELLKDMRCLALFGDSITTDHISPAGAFRSDSPAGLYLKEHGVREEDFNSYGSRRGNHLVMMRGTFANVRIKNKMVDGKEGGYTKLMPEGKLMTIFEASEHYAKKKTPLIVFAGADYGMGSSRDWAAKGSALLGVKAVVAQSFERIHRSNLIGMGVLPLVFKKGESIESLNIKGDELFTITGIEKTLHPRQEAVLEIHRNGKVDKAALTVRLDTPIEIDYYQHGGIMPYVLRHRIAQT